METDLQRRWQDVVYSYVCNLVYNLYAARSWAIASK